MCPVKVWTSVPSTWYSRTLAVAEADHKVHAVGQRRDAEHPVVPTSKVRSRAPSSVHSFAVPSPSR